MTCALRCRISSERGPGIAVRSSIDFVAAIGAHDNAAAGPAAYLYRDLSRVDSGLGRSAIRWGNLPVPPDPFHWSASRTGRYAASEGSCRERLDRVEAGGVPEHEALDVLQAGGLDLILDVGERVGAAEREVLEPRDQHRLVARDLRAEVPQGVGDRRARAVVGIDDVVLAGHVV